MDGYCKSSGNANDVTNNALSVLLANIHLHTTAQYIKMMMTNNVAILRSKPDMNWFKQFETIVEINANETFATAEGLEVLLRIHRNQSPFAIIVYDDMQCELLVITPA